MKGVARPGTTLLRPSPVRWLLVGAGSAVLVVAGIWLVSKGQGGGWLSIVFFGLCLAVCVVNLLPDASLLELSPEGLRVRSLFRDGFVRWGDVQAFTVRRVGFRRIVGWNYAPGYALHAAGRRVAAGLTGLEGALPDSYGLSPKALAELLEQWRQRYGRRR